MDNFDFDRQGAAARKLLDYTQTGLIALARDGRILFANAPAKSILGLDGLTTTFVAEACIRLDSAEQTRLSLLLQRKYTGPLRLKSHAGQTLVVTQHEEEDGTLLLAFDPAASATHTRTSRDALTGLADRQGFQDRLEDLCTAAPGEGIAVLLIDFAGAETDDAQIKRVAERLRTIFRDADVLGRWGVDAFAVAMAALPEVPALAERLLSALGRPFLPDQQQGALGANIGIAFSPQHGTDAEALIRAAELALHRAKDDGSATVRVFNDDLDLRTRTRHVLAEDLRRAIPLQQLELHFQPQIGLAKRTLEGFEALVRWNHPRRGQLHPSHFIRLAEEMGLIVPLGEWVLHEACRVAKSWPDSLVVAVNVSAKQLLDRDRLPRAIATTLASLDFPASRLEIEITESAFAGEAEALDILKEIHAMGVRVSMDDFGTGYSSLSQLRRFPFNKLKIDKSFVQDIGHSSEASAVVRAIAALGQSLGMTTIAEGVETAEQEARCRAEGCTEIQGYRISRPVPATDLPALIAKLSRKRTRATSAA